jgi:hypothetical protein
MLHHTTTDVKHKAEWNYSSIRCQPQHYMKVCGQLHVLSTLFETKEFPQCPLKRRLGGSWCQPRHGSKEKYSCSCQKVNSGSSGHSHHYTVCIVLYCTYFKFHQIHIQVTEKDHKPQDIAIQTHKTLFYGLN